MLSSSHFSSATFSDSCADVLLKSSDVKYVTLHDLDEVLELLERLEDEEVVVEDEEGASEDNEFERFIHGELLVGEGADQNLRN